MRQECEAKLTLTSTNYETKIATLEKELSEAREPVRDVQHDLEMTESTNPKTWQIVEFSVATTVCFVQFGVVKLEEVNAYKGRSKA